MSETVKASNVSVRPKISPAQEEAHYSMKSLEDASMTPHETEKHQVEENPKVIPQQMPTLTLSIEQIAAIVASTAHGRKTHIHLAEPSTSVTERLLDNTLGAVGDGLHRVADGARDIVGGLIDIVTLGRSGRRG